MSASGPLDPRELLEMASEISIAEAARRGVGAWVLAVVASVITGTQQLFAFLFLPFELLIGVAEAGAQGFLIDPLALIPFGIAESARAITGSLGLAGLPVAVIVVLVTLGLVAFSLRFATTGGIIPNVFIDNPLVEFFFTTPEEEEEEGGS